MSKKFFFCTLVASLIGMTLWSQDMPIGYWRSHLPYNNAVGVATDGNTLFSASSESFFTYNVASNEITTYSKSEGMADIGIATIGYDANTGYAIIAYANGNIDLFKDETFYNIPDLKLKTISPKKINNVYTENGMAYLSTSFGIVVLNLAKRETKETYSFSINAQTFEVKEMTGTGNYFYAATAKGLYRANKNHPNLQAFSSWQLLDSRSGFVSVTGFSGSIYVASNDSVFMVQADTLAFVYKSPYAVTKLNATNSQVLINEYIASSFSGKVKILSPVNNQIVDSFNLLGQPVNTVKLSDNSYWVADIFNGLGKRNSSNNLDFTRPNGPSSSGSFDILPYNGDVWVAHGGYNENWSYLYNSAGLSHLENGQWKVYNRQNNQFLQDKDLTDFIALAKDPANGTLYAASYRNGLLELKPDGTMTQYKENSPYTEPHFVDAGSYRVSGLTFDQNRNLWITNFGSVKELAVKTPEGNGYKFRGGGSTINAAYVLVDDNNIKWYILAAGADGVAAYDDNFTPDNPADDRAVKITASQYGLSSIVNCIAKDKENAIWIGTNDGIGVITCSSDQVFSGQCEIRKPIVQYDQFAGFLFQNEKVRTIAVDGANRKWIGTTNGVWLVSPDGDKIVYRFTAENSPLPSNDVRKIAVDPVTGDVYIGTTSGLVSYRSTATEGGQTNEHVTTFPNPVTSGYSGTIAIRGLAENSDVRITDISGQLIYRTKALGGQAVWNGLDYTGRRPQSGVYLIFVSNKDGSQTHAGKMIFME